MAQSKRILVGVIGAPHGVRGECRVKSFTEDPAAIEQYRPLTTEDGGTRFIILGSRSVKDDMVVARFEGVTTREGAAALTNTRLYVDRSLLPAADEEEFYHADLIGLRAEAADGTHVGMIVAVPNYGAGDLLEVQPETGDTILIAFTRAFVPVVDVAGGCVVLSAEALAQDASPDDDHQGHDDQRPRDEEPGAGPLADQSR